MRHVRALWSRAVASQGGWGGEGIQGGLGFGVVSVTRLEMNNATHHIKPEPFRALLLISSSVRYGRAPALAGGGVGGHRDAAGPSLYPKPQPRPPDLRVSPAKSQCPDCFAGYPLPPSVRPSLCRSLYHHFQLAFSPPPQPTPPPPNHGSVSVFIVYTYSEQYG